MRRGAIIATVVLAVGYLGWGAASLVEKVSAAPSALKTITATGLDQKVPNCGTNEQVLALFYITGIDNEADVPPSVAVTTNGGLDVSYPNFEFQDVPHQVGPVAGYKGFAPSGAASASTQIYAAWSGTFFLEEYFCGPGPTPRPPTVQFNASAPTMCIPTTASNIPVLFTLITSGAVDFDHVGSGLLTASGNGTIATNPVTVEPDGSVQDLVTFPLADATKAEDVNIVLTFAGSDFRFDKTDDFTLPMVCPLSTTTTTTGGTTTTTTQPGGTTTTTVPGGGGTTTTVPTQSPVVPPRENRSPTVPIEQPTTTGTLPVFVTG